MFVLIVVIVIVLAVGITTNRSWKLLLLSLLLLFLLLVTVLIVIVIVIVIRITIVIIIPGHALHEKGLQRQIGDGTLVSSQERRALAVPLINRGSTADFVPPSVYIRFRVFVLPKRRPGQFLRLAGGQEGGLSPGRIDTTASRPTQPRSPSPPRRAPPRPDRPVVCPGFGFDKLLLSLLYVFVLLSLVVLLFYSRTCLA